MCKSDIIYPPLIVGIILSQCSAVFSFLVAAVVVVVVVSWVVIRVVIIVVTVDIHTLASL